MNDYAYYEDFVAGMAFYPGAEDNVGHTKIIYPALGLIGEATEVLEAVTLQTSAANVIKEAGDTLFYLTTFARSLDSSLTKLFNQIQISEINTINTPIEEATNLVLTAGRTTELVKKALRDDSKGSSSKVFEHPITPERKNLIEDSLASTLTSLIRLGLSQGASLEEIAQSNIKKLTDRDRRGVLSGDGDNR
jgi:hypothetical protein